MFRNLIPELARRYRVVAPDYPGFGQSAMPARSTFAYTFDHYAQLVDTLTGRLGVDRYALYLMDYGAPVGFRLATAHPERVTALIVQNGNAYEEGLGSFWDPIRTYWASGSMEDREALRRSTTIETTTWQYTHGVPDPTLLSPDAWTVDQVGLDRPATRISSSTCSMTTATVLRSTAGTCPTPRAICSMSATSRSNRMAPRSRG